jgi:endonuclease YncB( thermonuclease family)
MQSMQTLKYTALYYCLSKCLPVFIAVFIACLSACGYSYPYQPATPVPTAVDAVPIESVKPLQIIVNAKLVRVVDGDTIVVDIDGKQYKVRYIGMDTPETVHPFKPVQYFGKEASEKNRELLAGKEIRLEKDVSETDRYGRLLRYVWAGDIMVNTELVRLGYAVSYTYPPDVKYQDIILQLEREARENNRGLLAEKSED